MNKFKYYLCISAWILTPLSGAALDLELSDEINSALKAGMEQQEKLEEQENTQVQASETALEETGAEKDSTED